MMANTESFTSLEQDWYQKGYDQAIEDMAPLRASHKALVEALRPLYEFVEIRQTPLGFGRARLLEVAKEALAQAEALEKGEV